MNWFSYQLLLGLSSTLEARDHRRGNRKPAQSKIEDSKGVNLDLNAGFPFL